LGTYAVLPELSQVAHVIFVQNQVTAVGFHWS
jgi:hypothetical protein